MQITLRLTAACLLGVTLAAGGCGPAEPENDPSMTAAVEAAAIADRDRRYLAELRRLEPEWESLPPEERERRRADLKRRMVGP